MESCLHRGEKDRRRKDRKGAKAESHERSRKNNRALPSRAHCRHPPRPSLALGHCNRFRTSNGHLGNLTKRQNLFKNVLILFRSWYLTLPHYILLTVTVDCLEAVEFILPIFLFLLLLVFI